MQVPNRRLIMAAIRHQADGTTNVHIWRYAWLNSHRYRNVSFQSLCRLVNTLQPYVNVGALEARLRPNGWTVYPVEDKEVS